MNAALLTVAIAEKEREAEAARERLAVLDARLEASARRTEALREVLGEGATGQPLAELPLHAALIGAVAGNAAMFFSFVEYLTKFREVHWNFWMVVSLLLGAIAYVVARRPGAGGLARVGLRRFTLVCLVIACAGLVVAVGRVGCW